MSNDLLPWQAVLRKVLTLTAATELLMGQLQVTRCTELLQGLNVQTC